MVYRYKYETPKEYSDLIMESDEENLISLYFVESSKMDNPEDFKERELPIFKETIRWLDSYFKGEETDFISRYKLENLTPFRQEVLDILINIEYGNTMSYNDIAKIIASRRKKGKMSARAVGNAVGKNPLCIIIPCHRVIGSNGFLTGYNGGINNKIALLTHEGNNIENNFVI